MFTQAQKVSIRKYLGHHGRFLQTDEALEKALESLGAKPAYQAEVVALLGKCDEIDIAIQSMLPRFRATKVGPLELDGAMELDRLRSIGRQYSSQIAALLGVEMRHDAWAGAGVAHSSGWHGPQGGGGMIPFGG